jgi:hypothetical protein
MNILHISHHLGCMRDHAYVYEKLGFDYTFWKFPKGLFKISKEIADRLWNERKEYFNEFDYIVTSDTAPLSRIFMENIGELKPKVVVWICNRFDYSMESDGSFYELFQKVALEHREKFKIVPYSDFEHCWCNCKGVKLSLDTITPIGIEKRELDQHIDGLQELCSGYVDDGNAKQHYKDVDELRDRIFIPIYGNDNAFFPLKNICETNNIPYFNGGYEHPEDLKVCKGLVTFPDAFSKLIAFETIQNEVIVFLPSEQFLIQLHPTTNNNTRYWFNNPLGYLNKETIKFCEWYRYKECRVYFDSIEDMVHKIKTLTPEIIEEKRRWCRIYGKQIEEENLLKWSRILTNNNV